MTWNRNSRLSGHRINDDIQYPIFGANLKIIDRWLEEDKQRPKKPRHASVRVYNRLKTERDFQGAATTVRRYVREAKQVLGLKSTGADVMRYLTVYRRY